LLSRPSDFLVSERSAVAAAYAHYFQWRIQLILFVRFWNFRTFYCRRLFRGWYPVLYRMVKLQNCQGWRMSGHQVWGQ